MEDKNLTLERLYNNIIENKDIENTYTELSQIMADIDCFQEEAGCLERLWHITKKHSLMIKVGEILSDKLNNHKAAQYAFNNYFLASNPKFYNVYTQNIKKLTQNLNFQSRLDDFSMPIVKLADKYNLLIYIFKYANHIKNHSFILQKSSKLNEIEQKAIKIFDENCPIANAYMNEIKGAKKHFSTIISTVNDNLGLNILALNFNSENLKAHINILNTYISEEKYNDALNWYNNKYAPTFSLQQITNPIELCKYLTDLYRDKQDYYSTLKFQKIALELELGV